MVQDDARAKDTVPGLANRLPTEVLRVDKDHRSEGKLFLINFGLLPKLNFGDQLFGEVLYGETKYRYGFGPLEMSF